MGLTRLHLVDRDGQNLAAATRDAVNDAYKWALVEFPNLDQAAVAGWAEDLGRAMADHPGHIEFPRRYAISALKGKILGWFRRHPGREIGVGVGAELEQWVGIDSKAELIMERTVLFEQLKTKLNESKFLCCCCKTSPVLGMWRQLSGLSIPQRGKPSNA
jgi:hypothetical protein